MIADQVNKTYSQVLHLRINGYQFNYFQCGEINYSGKSIKVGEVPPILTVEPLNRGCTKGTPLRSIPDQLARVGLTSFKTINLEAKYCCCLQVRT